MHIYLYSPEAFLELLEKEWVKRSPDGSTTTALGRLWSLAGHDPQMARAIAAMPFLRTWEQHDLLALEFFEDLVFDDAEGLQDLVSYYALQGGLTDEQLGTIKGTYLELQESPTGAIFTSLPWIRDGVSDSEKQPAFILQRLALEAEPVFLAMAQKSWVQDGLSADEVGVLGSFWGMAANTSARHDEKSALRISAMQFLDDVDGIDAAAMEALSGLTWLGDGSTLPRVLDHPRFAAGIASEDAIVVAALGYVAASGEGLLERLLEPGGVMVRERVVALPRAGEVKISVLNLNPGSFRTIDILEDVVRSQEEFMLTPFPKRYIGLFVLDGTVNIGGGGAAGIVTIDPGYEEDRLLIAHEVAHTYWPFSPAWIAEGAAEFLMNILEVPQYMEGPQDTQGCPLADTLGELDALVLERRDAGLSVRDVYYSSGCAYSLGRGLFADLYGVLGDDTFRQGFRRLYLTMRDNVHDAECTGIQKGICYVKRAFVTDASPEAALLAEPAINRWYYGSPEGPTPEPR